MTQLEQLLEYTKRKTAGVHPELAVRTMTLVKRLWVEERVAFAAFEGYRSLLKQRALYYQGRYPLATVNTLRKQAGLYMLDPTENRRKVTKIQVGLHNLGLAVDLVEDGNLAKMGVQPSWKAVRDYIKIGRIAKQVGLQWGGFWKSWKDYPHVQLTGGMRLSQALLVFQHDGMAGVWAEVDRRLRAA